MGLKYINQNGEEVIIAGKGLNGKDGGVETGSVIGWTGKEIPEGYEENSTMLSAIANAFFPVGYTFIDTKGDIDYSNHLGLVWEKTLQGVTPVGQNLTDTDFAEVGATGGEKTHTLIIEEMPYHGHPYYYNWDGAQAIGGTWKTRMVNSEYGGVGHWPGNSELLDQVSFVGGDQAHNIMQPYQVVTFWTRVG